MDKLAEAPAVQQETRPVLRITGPTDEVFLNAQQRVALEVGTGATVFVENSQGFTDFVVWNPWTANEFYGNFVCVENALISQPVTLAPVRPNLQQPCVALVTHLRCARRRRSGPASAPCSCATGCSPARWCQRARSRKQARPRVS